MSRGRRAISVPAQTPQRPESFARRLRRHIVQRLAILLALLILFYATSLHGLSSRTFILAGLLLLFLYWVFKGVL